MQNKGKSYSKNKNAKNQKRDAKFKGNNRNGRGSSNKMNDSDLNSASSDKRLSSLNDISWYSRNPELLASASQFPYPYKPGMQITMPNVVASTSPDVTTFNETVTIPGIMAFRFIPTIGYSEDVNSPVSIAAKELYARVRKNYSGSLDADAPDMMMYNLALDSIHAYIAHLKRIYRAVSTYSPYNRDYPESILAALLGVRGGSTSTSNIAYLQKSKMQFWGAINELIHMANKFVLPKDMDLYDRHRWMCEHVYLDNPTPNSQSYVFVPKGFWMIDETGETGTRLKYKALPSTANDAYYWSKWYDYGRELIQALSNWDDAYTISGYYSRAFEGDGTYISDLLQYDEKLLPVFVPEVLTQIENIHTVHFDSISTTYISQDPNTNAITFTPNAQVAVGMPRDSVYLNLHTANPTGADSTIASRLCAFVDMNNHIQCGTEVVTDICTYIGTNEDHVYTSEYNVALPSSASALVVLLGHLARLSWFNKHPIIALSNVSALTEAATFWKPLGEIENFTVVPHSAMEQLHRVCVYSEFNCFR